MTRVWKPDKNYKFPKKLEYGKNRSFNYTWLEQFSWLAYSAAADGAFCLPCVLFAHQTSSKKGIQLDRLFHSPINTWTSATRKFKEHETNSETHKSALLIASEFKRSMEHASVPVHHQIDQAAARMAEAKLASILKTVILCGKQNLPL